MQVEDSWRADKGKVRGVELGKEERRLEAMDSKEGKEEGRGREGGEVTTGGKRRGRGGGVKTTR